MTEESSTNQIECLLTRANTLLSELDAFQAYLSGQRQNQLERYRNYRRSLLSEVKRIEKISNDLKTSRTGQSSTKASSNNEIEGGHGESEDEAESKCLKLLSSSNLPYFEAVWSVARKCRGITAFKRKIYLGDRPVEKDYESAQEFHAAMNQRPSVTVDVFAENGTEWIKVSSISMRKLLFDMANMGWTDEFSLDRDDTKGNDNTSDFGNEDGNKDDESMEINLIRTAKQLKAAAGANRTGFQHPKIRFILPRITEGEIYGVDVILSQLRATGATVECGGQLDLETQLDLPPITPEILR